jgi:hypothetical protein
MENFSKFKLYFSNIDEIFSLVKPFSRFHIVKSAP